MSLKNSTLLTDLKSMRMAIANNYKKQPLILFFIVALVLLNISKLSLIGEGFLALIDEFRYFSSGKALQNFSKFEIKAGLNDLFSTQSRPANAIVNIIPISIQYITANIFGLNYLEIDNSYPLFLFNFAVYCLILLVHFKFSKLVLKDHMLALISVILFSSLTNSHLYLRHALPYDQSLLVFYFLIYKVSVCTKNRNLTNKKSFLLGFFAFIAFLIYPGYIPLIGVIFFILFFGNLDKDTLRKNIFYSIYFTIGNIFSLSIFEVLSRIGGTSYILDAIGISSKITQGSFEESFTFIIKYLIEVEQLTGIIILISLLIFCYLVFFKYRNTILKKYSLLILIVVPTVSMFLIYASAGYFFDKVVLYGRLLHQYFPFICILTLFTINLLLKKIKSRNLVLTTLSVVFIINYIFNFIQYHSFSYPKDIAWELIKTHKIEQIKEVNEYPPYMSMMPSEKYFKDFNVQKNRITQSENLVVANLSFFYPIEDLSKYQVFHPKENYSLLYSKRHFMNFKAYQYEGCKIIERQNLDKMDLHIKVFSE